MLLKLLRSGYLKSLRIAYNLVDSRRQSFYRKKYSTDPRITKKYLFFNQIDYEIAKHVEFLKDKAEIYLANQKHIAPSASQNLNFIFLNLTDYEISNKILFEKAAVLKRDRNVDIVIYRPHPRLKATSSLPGFIDLSTTRNQSICDVRSEHCQFIVTAVSSSIGNLKNYNGEIFLSEKASMTTWNLRQFRLYVSVASKYFLVTVF